MPLSTFQQYCSDTGCPDNVHTLALWQQLATVTAERDKLKTEREQMEKQKPVAWCYGVSDGDMYGVTLHKGNPALEPLYAHPPVPDGKVMVDVTVLERVYGSLCAFCSDEGWGLKDMDSMDDIGSVLARHKAMLKAAQQGE